ncbi:inorganic phosphate transporter [Blattabacterium cuenoti]|uniref:inorganic phosphate transporter n=1 Tax=Blattabacterium cuenoti TaxID=1653831 RepID=UPI00163C26F1|nr:inorganic phosphate transporter [Blattabacterium cuenoti]
MKFFYPSIIVVLFLLSIFDLIVGLINDAVNFLNSAIGSQVSSRRTIMIFASLGILLGAFLSSGMMEVARKGVFDPSYFYFSDIIFIFLAVMISDIILLDIFNTLGLPTSTTVSMVFCLLGGAFSIAMVKMSSPLNNEPFHHLTLYIKAEKTLTISIGIFLSIIISFTSGAFIHYFIRSLFSFEYESKLKYAGVIWTAVSLSSMTYFLIVKGLHSTLQGFLNDNYLTGFSLFIQHFIKWIHHNFFVFLLILFSTWTIVAKIFVSLGYNILKFVVLYGTFSLAMAFAGNDLVNFIGIPIAGIQSYNIWKEAGSPPAEKFNMKSLSGNVQVPSLVLIFAGMIMILTLWFSKKTKNITSTEINLSRQNEGPEKFLSNSFSRGIVRFFLCFGNYFFKFFPKRLLVKIEKNFKQKKTQKEESVAFDLVRASANLTISSILISIATVQKLPLSTTFVTFMVSMGTSLSDRAWDRESAVYRVSGVLKVIRGWFLTGLIAFTMAGVTAAFLYFFKAWALSSLIFLIIFVFYKSYKKYHKKIKEEKPFFDIIVNLTLETTLNKTFDILKPILEYIEVIYKNSIEGITQENLKTLQSSRNSFLKVKENFTKIQNSLTQVIQKTKKSEPIAGILYLHIYNKTKEIIESSDMITNHTLFHVINSHKPLKYQQKKNLLILEDLMIEHFNIIKKITIDKNCKKIQFPCPIQNKILKKIEEQMNQQVMGIIYKKYGTKNTFLMLDILLQSKKITENIENIILLYHNALSHISSKKDASFLAF